MIYSANVKTDGKFDSAKVVYVKEVGHLFILFI